MVTTRLEILQHVKGQGLRPDLASADLVQLANYLVSEGKGPGERPPRMFTGPEMTADFRAKWMAQQAAMTPDQPGYIPDEKKWAPEQAWCFERVTGDLWFGAGSYETRHYRLIMSPDPRMWPRIGLGPSNSDRTPMQERVQTDVMKAVTKLVMERVESDHHTRLHWVASVHTNTDAVHSHTCIRGLTADGQKVWFGDDYWKVGFKRHCRRVLWDMFIAKEVANVG